MATLGSTPNTRMPNLEAASATKAPIAPQPMTPKVLPMISVPANAPLAFSIDLLINSSPLFSLTHSMDPRISRAAKSIIAIVNSLTAFAFAPGVLKTTTPSPA